MYSGDKEIQDIDRYNDDGDIEGFDGVARSININNFLRIKAVSQH